MTLYLDSAMNTHPTAPHQQLDAQLTGILTRVEHLRTLHLTAEIGLEQALDESRRALGALAQYRHTLQRALQAAAVVLIFLLSATPAQAQVALGDGASATFWKPAGLAFQQGTEVALTHSNGLPEFNAGLFYEHENPLNGDHRFLTFGAGIRYNMVGVDFS